MKYLEGQYLYFQQLIVTKLKSIDRTKLETVEPKRRKINLVEEEIVAQLNNKLCFKKALREVPNGLF